MKRKYLILVMSILLFSCTEDGLDQTIFIQDEEDYNLPAYTEWGYNTFGAKYERDYFLVSNEIIPCKIVYNDGYMQFLLHGKIRGQKEMKLIFIFPIAQMNDYEDLLQLHNTEIDLAQVECTVKIIEDGLEDIVNIKKGTLKFKRAQLLSVDNTPNRTILSGNFDLLFLRNEFPVAISDGRFDLGITNNVFYSY